MRLSKPIAILIAVMLLSIPVCAAGSDPIFAGVWSEKESVAGGLFIDQTWEQLVSNWKALGSNQYLADVEAYRHKGQLRFASSWRVGPGNGALFAMGWEDFAKKWKELGAAQDLIDIEVINTNGTLSFLGVWRHKPGPKRGGAGGSGALFAGLTWEQLVAHWKELGGHQYLSEVETYLSDGKRLFVGVWRVGNGNGALYLMNDWVEFNKFKRSLNATQEMLDFEMFQNDQGEWNFLGVWRFSGKQAGLLHVSSVSNTFRPLTAVEFLDKWQSLKPTQTLVDISIANPATILRGNLKCKYGDGDCNRCANDVVKQFRIAFEKGHKPIFNGGSWSFDGDRKYPPDNVKPEDSFSPGRVGKHIQGLVRTNSSIYPYAGSHSHKSKGSIFFITNKDGKNKLYSMHNSTGDHPGGVHVLGDGLFVPEGNILRWFSIDAVNRVGFNQTNSFKIPENDKDKGLQGGGGGIGLAKLGDGTYLLVVTAPGNGFRLRYGLGAKGAADDNMRARYTRFYRISGHDAGHPDDSDKPVEFLGQYEHGHLSKSPETPMAYSENLSLVTECGTGHLYTIHTTGQYRMNGDGYWRLSRVESGGEGGDPRLKHISIVKQEQDLDDCHHRSSATVHVNKSGQLEFLCSERRVTLKKHGTFNFKEGKP